MVRGTKKCLFWVGALAIAAVALVEYFGPSSIAFTSAPDMPSAEQASTDTVPLQLTDDEQARGKLVIIVVLPMRGGR